MNLRNFIAVSIVVLFSAVLYGCATSSNVKSIGPDTYSVTAIGVPSSASGGGARSMALEDASAHCKNLSRNIEVLDVTNKALGDGRDTGTKSAEVVFRCVAPQ